MQTIVRTMNGETAGEIELRDDIFGIEPNRSVMHQALVRQLANMRQGTHDTKTRAEVAGTGAKWFRQKGTGHARHGNRRAPNFVKGGIAHGPTPRSYRQDMPRKMRRLALRSALSAKAAANQIVLVDHLTFDQPKTKAMLGVLKNLNITGSAIVLLPERNVNVEKSITNLENVRYLRAGYLNVRDLLGHDYVIVPQASLAVIEGILG